jgi:hypothetical protein
MEVRDWILIVSAVIVVVGWFVNGIMNRKHEIAKKRMEYRLDALHSFLPVFFTVQKNAPNHHNDPIFQSQIHKARSNFQLYGYNDEVDAFESIISSINEGDTEKYVQNLQDLIILVRKRIRLELKLGT